MAGPGFRIWETIDGQQVRETVKRTETLQADNTHRLREELAKLAMAKPKDGAFVLPPERTKAFLRKEIDLALAIYDLNNEGMVVL